MVKNMNYNFEKLKERIIDAIKSSDLDDIKQKLCTIKGNTLITGVGGSRVVANYFLKYLNAKNSGFNYLIYPDDLNHSAVEKFDNIIVCSYSGKGLVVNNSFKKNNLNKYLFSSKIKPSGEIISISYNSTIEKESSFIALASTLIPITILLYCHLGVDKSIFIDMIEKMFSDCNVKSINKDSYEIFYNYNSSTAYEFLESTMVESAICTPISQELYSFCHGRSTFQKYHNTGFIMLNNEDTDLVKLLKELFIKNDKDVIYFKDFCMDHMVNDYYKVLQGMFLCKNIATSKKIDLSKIDYDRSFVKEAYYFKGSI